MAAPLRAQDKLTFLLALVPFLIDRSRVSVADAARHFSTTPEHIRQAVTVIAMSGVPGSTNAYLHNDLFDIDWDSFEQHDEIVIVHQVAIDDSPRFSSREAAALIAGLQYLSGLPENIDRDSIASLMAKLARGASSTPSAVAIAGGDVDSTLATIRDAVSGSHSLEFDYVNARGESERRVVDPLRVESADRDWYLRAWCHRREAVRTFRLDRMSEVIVSDVPVADHPDVTLPDTLFQNSADDLTVTLDVASSALPLLADYRARVEDAGAEVTRVSVRVAHVHSLKRLVAGLPGVVRVIDPLEARAAVAEWAEAGAALYEGDDQVSG
ncbi:WYL domain-containing protein [Agromyces atrinae]|uniref:helix-turn-helix transcriptional regulator n=1 Tax=Agromyces atrinae TaxID=592376 RepID=UPI001F5ABEB9|nr:WYL domain-containing protein [Agromyces atrinae]MCI2958643.1 WYL domain-containing protein [Agromyces atrinae]